LQVWSIIWNLLAYAFTGDDDSFQLWSSLLATCFSIFGFVSLFYFYPTRKHTLFLNFVAWGALFLVTLLEVIFLVSLLVNANTYELVKTNYNTLRIQYYHSAKQIVLLFVMGLVGILSLLAEAVAAQRCQVAIEDFVNMEKLLKTYSFSLIQLT
jgi:hypothetical protein